MTSRLKVKTCPVCFNVHWVRTVRCRQCCTIDENELIRRRLEQVVAWIAVVVLCVGGLALVSWLSFRLLQVFGI